MIFLYHIIQRINENTVLYYMHIYNGFLLSVEKEKTMIVFIIYNPIYRDKCLTFEQTYIIFVIKLIQSYIIKV